MCRRTILLPAAYLEYIPGCLGPGSQGQSYCYDPFAEGSDSAVMLSTEDAKCDNKRRCDKCSGEYNVTHWLLTRIFLSHSLTNRNSSILCNKQVTAILMTIAAKDCIVFEERDMILFLVVRGKGSLAETTALTQMISQAKMTTGVSFLFADKMYS